ncbi:hypothetical protein RhiJN_02495 [Ceratobasidium sp. AG-Ba]|nr:hypothetical protein RhiJN_02495 [Ceratobasidium sp. AG-Ba]
MAKLTNKPTCRYCGWSGKSFTAVERHIGHKASCSTKRQKELNQYSSNSSRSTQRHTQSNTASRPQPGRSHPPTVPHCRSLSVTIEEVEDNEWLRTTSNKQKNGPPQRNRNAILEELNDAPPIEDRPLIEANPPARSRRVTVEEIEDEDMPRRPRWGPHPFAKPTRPSLFPECHPDPTAGVAQEFYDIDREPPPAYTSKLAEPDVFCEAFWLDNLRISRANEAQYFSLPRTKEWHWNNLTEFEQEVGRLPCGPSWFRETIIVKGDQGDEILDLWKHDIIKLIQMLLSDPRFIPHIRFAPERHYDSAAKENRVYDKMWSGKWWWRMQNILGKHATVVPIILGSDKTKLTVFSGNQQAWPVYLTIGNISTNIRRCPSERATLLIGYIPVSNLGNISNEQERSEAHWQLFHACMESILEPLKVLSRTGIDILCADGGVRRIFPILAAYIADYPEQATIACVRKSCCPVCWIPTDKRGHMALQYPQRDRRRTLDALDDHWNGYSRTIKMLGIRPTRPFWADLPYVDISSCLAPDLLHKLDKGVFGDHLIRWTTILIGSNEMDRRTKGMPRFQGLRHFARGTSVISQWTGKETKALGRTFLAIVAGHEQPRLVTAVKSITDFMARAHKPEVTKRDLAAMTDDLLDFDRAKTVFVDPNSKRGLPTDERRFNAIPKIHSLTHYPYLISQLGAPEGFNTKITERLHIDFVKKPWSTTNHVNPIQQMVAYLQNWEAWALLRAYMHDTGLVLDPRFMDARREEEVDDGPEDLVEGSGNRRNDQDWQLEPTVWIAKRPLLKSSVKGAYLMTKHKAADLIPATIDYLRSLFPERTVFPISHNTLFKVWRRCKLHHRRLPFDPALDLQTDQVRAFSTTEDIEGRILRSVFFDVVLFSSNLDNGNHQGLHRKC